MHGGTHGDRGADAGCDPARLPLIAPVRRGRDSVLLDIVARTRADLAHAQCAVPLDELVRQIETRGRCRDFAAALRPTGDGRPRVIAELKRASPSKGLIRREFGVIGLSRDLARHGAAALSVLTEVHYFQGRPSYLQSVSAAVDIPVLRKDFILDEYQVYEARAWGADAVLLIAAVLDRLRLQHLHRVARDLGLAVLAEVHNREELTQALDAGAEIVGINSRDLHTFRTDLATVEALAADLPRSVIAVAESGIAAAADVARLRRAGVHAFLVGELLMRAASPGSALAALMSGGADGSSA